MSSPVPWKVAKSEQGARTTTRHDQTTATGQTSELLAADGLDSAVNVPLDEVMHHAGSPGDRMISVAADGDQDGR